MGTRTCPASSLLRFFGLEGRPCIARGEPRFAAEPREYGRPYVRGRVQDNDSHGRSPSPQQPEAALGRRGAWRVMLRPRHTTVGLSYRGIHRNVLSDHTEFGLNRGVCTCQQTTESWHCQLPRAPVRQPDGPMQLTRLSKSDSCANSNRRRGGLDWHTGMAAFIRGGSRRRADARERWR